MGHHCNSFAFPDFPNRHGIKILQLLANINNLLKIFPPFFRFQMLTFFVVHPLLMRKLTVILFFQVAFFSCAFSQITASYNTVEEGEGLSRILLKATPDFKESSKINLQWESPVLQEDHYFRLEKSRTGKDFELMAVIKGKAGQSVFEFTDEKPGSSSNFYRVKSSSNGGYEMSSEVISTGVSPIKFCS